MRQEQNFCCSPKHLTARTPFFFFATIFFVRSTPCLSWVILTASEAKQKNILFSRTALKVATVAPAASEEIQGVDTCGRMANTITKPILIRLANERDNCEFLAQMINDAYSIGEKGILVDTIQEPFKRATPQDLHDMIRNKQVIVLCPKGKGDEGSGIENGRIIGCVKVQLLENPKSSSGEEMSGAGYSCKEKEQAFIGQWGCLAVDVSQQGHGYGGQLIRAAEQYLKTSYGCTHAQLEILSPTQWKHEHKERLRLWYTTRLGYELLVPGDYDASTEHYPAGMKLGETFRLATDSDYTYYRKEL